MDRNELPVEPRNLGVPSGVSKMISEPVVRLTQIMHLSCTNTNIINKRIGTRFHMTTTTYYFNWVRPRLFLSLWYVRRKLSTYLASRLALNELLVEPHHLRVPLGSSKMISEP
jgi:hypothetical protein